MKVVIYTQYRENYGEPGNPHWKFKGGSTYVVEKMDSFDNIDSELKGLIEYSNEMSEEYISSTHIVPDDQIVCDEWESPIVLSKGDDGRWTASVVHQNDGQFIDGIATKSETWTMLPESARSDYTAVYTMTDDRTLTEEGLIEMLKMKKG
jgi:hypothetical protein